MADLPNPIARQALVRPDEPAIIDNEGSLTFEALHATVEATAAEIRKSFGIGPPRVALLCDNSRAMIILLTAVWRAGLTACPISTRLPVTAVNTALARLGTELLVSDRTDFPAATIPLRSGITAGKIPSGSDPAFSFEADRVAVLLFTSGSASEPKIAALTYGNLYYNALGSNQNIAVTEGDRWLLSLPLYHVGGIGILFRTLLGGGAIAVPDTTEDLFLQARRFRVTHLSLVTTQLQRLLDQPSVCADLRKQLTTILLGGSSFSSSLIENALAAGLPLARSYGLTEAASQVTTTALTDSPDCLLGSGRLLPYRELKISDTGEILVKGHTLFSGYWNNGSIDTARDDNGWFATGDRGELDRNGNLKVLGRRDNMFISGGENIQPEEIEQALSALSPIAEALVVPVDDARYGMRPVAFVRTFDGMQPDETRLRRDLRAILPGFKIPDHIYPWPEQVNQSGLKPSRAYFRRLANELP
jgi:O-succinylbenzoic acid--CoA ligase